MNKYLTPIDSSQLKKYISPRAGETRLGQSIKLLQGNDFEAELAKSEARFVLLGIPEDIGVRANYGKPGTAGFWESFLSVFLLVQDNQFLSGNNLMLAGEINCADLMQKAENASAEALYELVKELDVRVESVLQLIFRSGKIPVIIGGGHNNAYPIIKALASVVKNAGVINVDPHADLRHPEGRHSGNGFSYALKEGLMNTYTQVGLHESYNNQFILDQYATHSGRLYFLSYDDFIREKWNFAQLNNFIRDIYMDIPFGFELDCDSIENMPSSAATPSGFSSSEIRKLTMMIAGFGPKYFHLPEALPTSTPINSAKLVTYLVTDFIKNFK